MNEIVSTTLPEIFGTAIKVSHIGAPKPTPSPTEKVEEVDAPASDKKVDIQDMLNKLETYVQGVNRELQFMQDVDNGNVVIKVIDASTDELIRQIPSEEMMDLSRRLTEAAGIILKAKA